MKVTVEESKYAQASAFIQSSVFQEYSFDEESATFKINLNALLVWIILSYLYLLKVFCINFSKTDF